MQILAAGGSDIGRKKRQNEDSLLIDEALRLYIVADGMGGHAAGDVASAMAIQTVEEFITARKRIFMEFAGDPQERDQILALVETAVRMAGKAIHAEALRDPAKRGMGTTCSLLLLTPHRGFIAHVGDSRVYLERAGHMYQLTEDHSLINELIKRGQLDPKDAHNASYQNAVTRAVGVYPDVQVDTLDFEVAGGDHFMLCSDGLTAHIKDDKEFAQVLLNEDLLKAPQILIARANERGGSDNITCICLHVNRGSIEQDELALKLTSLAQMPLFVHLTHKELVGLLNISEVHPFKNETIVFKEGSPSEHLFIVIEGEVTIEKGGIELAKLGAGGHFGEVGILDKSARSAQARASKDSRLIAIGRKPLFRLMRRNKELAVKLLWSFVHVLGQRLRATTQDLQHVKAHDVPLDFEDLLN